VLIAQITDIHVGFDRASQDDRNLQRLKAVVDRLSDGPNRPDMALLTGDLCEFGDAQSYALLAAALRDCPFPVWPMVGNHDAREPLIAAFPQTQLQGGFVQYAIEGDGVRFLLLDTLKEGLHGGAFCEARAAWLAAELADYPNTPTVIVLHHPPFETGIEWLDCDAGEPWVGRFAQAIAGHSQVRSILTGHLHRAIHTQWNGVAASVCPSTAPPVALDLKPMDVDRPDKRSMIVDEPPAYGLHRWDGRRITSHFEAVSDGPVLARFDETMQAVVKRFKAERRGD